MQDGALAANRYGKIISGATGKDSEHRSSGSSYKTRRSKKGMTISNNPECLSQNLGAECGNTAKGKFGYCWRMKTTTMRLWQKERRGTMKVYGLMGRTIYLMTSGTMEKVIKIVLLPGSMQKTVLSNRLQP